MACIGGTPIAEFQIMVKDEISALRLQMQDLVNGQALAQRSLRKMNEDVEAILAFKMSVPEVPPLQHRDGASKGKHPGVNAPEIYVDQDLEPVAFSVGTESQGSFKPAVSSQDSERDESPAGVGTHAKDSDGHTRRKSATPNRKSLTKSELLSLFEVSNKAVNEKKQMSRSFERANMYRRWQLLEARVKDLVLDGFIGFVVVMNSIFIGISADNWDGHEINIYVYIDLVFAIIFAGELAMKIRLHGWRGHFLGKDKISNCFDVTLVTLDTLQLLLVFSQMGINKALQEKGIPSASVFRVVRIARVSRILRVFRHEAFQDLLEMIEGILLGSSTLGWAFLLFALVIYILAIVARDAIGYKQEYAELFPYFNTVPRSIFTVFRCSFGDCSTSGGLPLAEYIQMYFGGICSLVYSLFVFFISIGLFNVVSAIFVDSTMSRAEENKRKEQQDRFVDKELWAVNFCTVARRCLENSGYELQFTRTNFDITDDMLMMEVKRDLIDYLCCNDPDTIAALTALDIDLLDHDKLADILDPDHSGTVGFPELIDGLRRLRGQPRRSDVVTIDLMVRSTQEKLDEMHKMLEKGFAKLGERSHEALDAKTAGLAYL